MYVEIIVKKLSDLLDMMLIIFIVSFMMGYKWIAFYSIIFGSTLIHLNIKEIMYKFDITLKNELLNMIIHFYYFFINGYNSNYIFTKIKSEIFQSKIDFNAENFIEELEKLNNNVRFFSLTQWIAIIKKTSIYDSRSIEIDIEELIDATMNDLFSERKSRVDKINELFVFPMAINLISMTIMIVYPYLRELI